jgi:hypothetical protein
VPVALRQVGHFETSKPRPIDALKSGVCPTATAVSTL